MKTILRTIVGSQAHGLATLDSDFDYRGVFINPTSEILSLKGGTKQTNWIEGKEDDTSWELGHFLHLATKCNPTILEVFLAPLAPDPIIADATLTAEQLLSLKDALSAPGKVAIVRDGKYAILESMGTVEGQKLRDLFPYIWNSKGVHDAFMGYGFNQRKKFLEDKDKRAAKYATAYLRTLYQAWELLTTGTFTIRVADTAIGPVLRAWKNGDFKVGDVIQVCTDWQQKVEEAYLKNPDKETDLEKVDEFLLNIRKNNW